MVVESHGYRPPEATAMPESKAERMLYKAKEYIARVIKVWSDSAEQNRHPEYFQSQDAMEAKVEIGEYINQLAEANANEGLDNDVTTILDVIGNRLYDLWHLEANNGQYISSEPGAWRHGGMKAVMKALMRKVGFKEERIATILPDGNSSASDNFETQGQGEKIIDGSEEFARRARPEDSERPRTEDMPDNSDAESVAGR